MNRVFKPTVTATIIQPKVGGKIRIINNMLYWISFLHYSNNSYFNTLQTLPMSIHRKSKFFNSFHMCFLKCGSIMVFSTTTTFPIRIGSVIQLQLIKSKVNLYVIITLIIKRIATESHWQVSKLAVGKKCKSQLAETINGNHSPT